MRTLQEDIQKMDNICAQKDIPWFDKIKKIIDIQYGTKNYETITCPYCKTLIKNNGDYTEEDSISISLNNRDEIWYYINTPCCGKRLFVTQTYNSISKSKKEYYTNLREQLYKDVEWTEGQYYRAKHKYRTICDILYNIDQQI